MILRRAQPNAMTAQGSMLWNKEFEIETVEPWPGKFAEAFPKGHHLVVDRHLAEVTGPYGQKTFVLMDFGSPERRND